ncbi:MAG: nucleoside triphosphate pyrophosphohydrolase [Halobacteriovoraceae bacterium]|nr:nucleoside triphosphate pyrophosphohydrolase [Halobacteriovoraceae bacterium]
MELPEFKRLVEVVKALRHPDTGCPWDLEQDHQTLVRFLIEETFEFKEAIEKSDFKGMEDEAGDVLLQVLLHSEIASETNQFNIESVSKNLADKLVRRHPHVFDNEEGKSISTQEVKENWEKIKAEEKQSKKKRAIKQKIIYGPSLKVAENIGHKTKDLNFDWENPQQVSWKVEEEWQELKEELMSTELNKERIGEELGDFLFSAAQLARHLDLDPEELCQKANKKFLNRFHKMEDLLNDEGKGFEGKTQEELDQYWSQVKMNEKN